MRSIRSLKHDIRGDQFFRDARHHSGSTIEIVQGDPPVADVRKNAHTIKEYSSHLRALVSHHSHPDADGPRVEAAIAATVRLILAHQKPDGSFSVAADRFTPVEPTTHALIALASLADPHGHRPPAIELALEFLVRQIRDDGSVRSAADAEDAGWPDGPALAPRLQTCLPPETGIRRIHLAALALIALAGWRKTDAAARVQAFLLQSHQSGTWGPFPEAPPSPASTALALYALTASGQNPKAFPQAVSYLRRSQRSGGWWPAEDEMWAVRSAEGIRLEITRVDTNSYAMLSLMRVGGLARLFTAARTFRHLKAELRAEAARWRPREQITETAMPPADNTIDEIKATLGRTESPLAMLTSSLMRTRHLARGGPTAI